MKVIREDDTWITYEVECLNGALGDMATEWWTQEDWDKHEKRVEEMTAGGTYLQPYTAELTIMKNEKIDSNPNYVSNAVSSYSFEILDFGKSSD